MNFSSTSHTIKDWLLYAVIQLKDAHVSSASLDAELILAHCLAVNRTWLVAHGNKTLAPPIEKSAGALLARRLKREPIAYILGHKEFYGRKFIVTPDVLIPRPESETMIELLKELISAQKYKNNRSKGQTLSDLPTTLVDVGTGSGCLGITAKLEIPGVHVILSDVSPAALTIAQQNANTLTATVTIVKSDLLSYFQPPNSHFDIILANLPYVDESWERSPETDHEPALALFADNHGLELINTLLDQAPGHMPSGGYILLEADPVQHAAIIAQGAQNGLVLETVRDYIVVLKKS